MGKPAANPVVRTAYVVSDYFDREVVVDNVPPNDKVAAVRAALNRARKEGWLTEMAGDLPDLSSSDGRTVAAKRIRRNPTTHASWGMSYDTLTYPSRQPNQTPAQARRAAKPSQGETVVSVPIQAFKPFVLDFGGIRVTVAQTPEPRPKTQHRRRIHRNRRLMPLPPRAVATA